MNADELKLITDAITTLGAQGKEAFVWFLVMKYGLSYFLHAVLWPAAMFTAYKCIRIMAGQGVYESALVTIRQITHPNWGGCITQSEIAAIVATVQRMKADSK